MIRVFPRKTKWTPTDKLAFIGDPPMFRPPDQLVKISCTFTWDINECERLYRGWSDFYSDVELGGPAFDDPGAEFTPGQFIKDGVTITSRGCVKDCEWCMVPEREGQIREYPILPGHNINDNNLLACSDKHVSAVFDMLRCQKKAIVFSGGLDAELFTGWHAELLMSINLGEAWFACDYPGAIKYLEKVALLVPEIKPRKRRAYVMIGFKGESLKNAESRLKAVYNMGFWPYAMLYRKKDEMKPKRWPKEWKKLQRTWCRPGGFKSAMKKKPNN